MMRVAATVVSELRRLVRRLTRVEVARPEGNQTSTATDPEMLRNIPPGGVGPS